MSSIKVSDVIGNSKTNKFFIGVLVILVMTLVFDGYDQAVYGASLPVLMKDLGIDAAVLGFVGTLSQYGLVVGAIVLGMMSDKIGRKKTLGIGIVLFSLGTGLVGFANTAAEIAVYRFVASVGIAGVSPICIAMATEYSPVSRRKLFVTITQVGISLGSLFAPLLGILILSSYGWRPMYFIALIPIIWILVIGIFLPEFMDILIKKGNKNGISQVLKKADPTFTANEDNEYVTGNVKNKNGSFVSLFKDNMARKTIIFWLMFAFSMYVISSMMTWLPKLMMNAGYPLGNSLWLLFTFTLGGILGTLISGIVASKLGYKKTIIIYAIITAVLFLSLIFTKNFTLLSIALCIIGAGNNGTIALTYAYTAESYPNAIRGTGIGWGASIGRFGGTFGPVVGGILIAQNMPVAVNFITLALPMVIVAILAAISQDNTGTLSRSLNA